MVDKPFGQGHWAGTLASPSGGDILGRGHSGGDIPKTCPTVDNPSLQMRLVDTEGNFVEVDLSGVQATVDGADAMVTSDCNDSEPCSFFFVYGEPGRYVIKATYCDVNVEETVEVPLDKAGCGPITQDLTLTFDLSDCPDES